MDFVYPFAMIMLAGILLWYSSVRLRRGKEVVLRPLPAYDTLEGHAGRAIESAGQLHVSMGRASLAGSASPTSLAALDVLSHLAREGCANGSPPLATVGDGTLLPIAQENLRYAQEHSPRQGEGEPGVAQFVASETDSYAFAGGVAAAIQQNKVVGNVLVGKFGPELGIVTEAAHRQHIDQVVGSNDLTALALGSMVTDNLLVGEELLASDAYLEGTTSQLAALQAQDWLRIIVIAAMLATAVYQVFS